MSPKNFNSFLRNRSRESESKFTYRELGCQKIKQFFCSGIINLLFDGSAYNTRGQFANCSYFSYYSTHKISARITGCPKSSFLYFVSPYFSTIGLRRKIVGTKVVTFNLIHYFSTCAIFWLEYSICVLPHQRCACANIFSSLFLFVFYGPNCSNSFLVFFCDYQER